MAQKKYLVVYDKQAIGEAIGSTAIEAAKQTGTIKIFPPVEVCRTVEVEAESTAEATSGLREVWPGQAGSQAYIVEKNKGEEK